ncbi:MAG: class I mannose-6-phosphate isomerase [Candidatus Omnitrophota bacterium]
MASKEELKKLLERPVHLAPNTYLHFYNGGKLRAKFMGEPDPKDDFRSEEWIFSTNRAVTPGRDNPPDKGYSRVQMPSGEIALLQDLLQAFPEETLGGKHYEKFGPNLGVLLKIFDVGDNAHIPVHWHPSPAFSSKHLNSPFGKNEAWIVLDTRPGAQAWVGFKEDIDKNDFKKWMEAQDVETMRQHMHVIKPNPRDVIFLTDGWVHSLGSGLCILEPQEPTDWNILSEWEGFPYKKEEAACGLDWDTALDAARWEAMSDDYLNNYVLRTPKVVREQDNSVEEQLVPDEAKKYFWVSRLLVGSEIDMPEGQGFHCLVPTQGQGYIKGAFGEVPISKSKSVFIPRCLPGYKIVNTGSEKLEVVCCYPPQLA